MTYKKKSYKKFVATAATATLVASAIVPVVSAASFPDVEETHEFATYINAAVDAGYIKGYADGTFGINDNLKRSQVVIIIGRYLEKLGYTSEATTSPWSDVKDEEVIKYGNIVKDAGVFTGYTDGTLKGGGFITRENMAVVLDRLAKTVKGTSLSEVAEDIEDVKIGDLATANADYQASIQALRDLGISTADNFNPKGNLKRGQFAKFIMNAVEAIDAIEVAEELAVESVSAINDNAVKVTFNTEVKDIKASDITITEPTSGNKVYVKSVKAGSDNKSVEVELYDTLVSEKTYDVEVKVGEKAVKGQFKFVLGEAAQILVEDQLISTASKKLDYKVLNADGVDITEHVTVAVESNSTAIVATKGEVTVNLADNQSAFVELKVAKKDGTVVSSKRVKVTVQAPKATGFGENWTLYTETKPTEEFYKVDNYKQDNTLNMKSTEYLDIELVDQFGKRFGTETSVRYESLDTSVAIIDAVTGKVTPRKEGKAVVKASIMDGSKVVATKVVELTVAGEAKLAGITTDKEAVNAVTTEGLTEKLDVRLVDQFGNVIAGDLKVEVADTKIATVTYNAADKDGQVELTVTGKKEGSTTVKLTAGTFTKTVVINVAEAGAVADYKVEGVKSELLVKDVDSTTDVFENKMTFSVKAVDANGLPKEVVKNPTVIVKDKDGKVVENKAQVASTGEVTITADAVDVEKGPFTLEVKVGTLTVLSTTYKVTDNRQAPEYKVKSNKVAITVNNTGEETNTTDLNVLFDGTVLDFGTTAVAVTDVDFVSNNEAVIVDADTTEAQGKVKVNEEIGGNASIYVDSVTVTVGTDTFVLDLEGLKVDVAVNVVEDGSDYVSPSPVQKIETKDQERYSVSLKFTNKFNQEIDSLEVALLDNKGNVVATNTAKEKLLTTINEYMKKDEFVVAELATSPFWVNKNKTSGSWNLGFVEDLTQDLEARVTFTANGVKYVVGSN